MVFSASVDLVINLFSAKLTKRKKKIHLPIFLSGRDEAANIIKRNGIEYSRRKEKNHFVANVSSNYYSIKKF